MNDETLHWLAGLLEGEGSFLKPSPSHKGKSTISVETTDKDVAEKVSEIFETKLQIVKKRKIHWKQSYRVRKVGIKAIEIMKRLHPLMSERRQLQIIEAIEASTVKSRVRINQKLIEQIFLLKSKKLNQAQIAQKVSLRRETVNKILRGKYKICDL